MKASFDVTTTEGQFKVFNAKSGASVSLKKLEDGELIEINGILQYTDTVDSYGAPTEATITVLFGVDGCTYAGVSDTVAKAGENLIDLMAATGMQTVKIAIIKQKSGKGNEFLNLRAVM